ncbi:MAG: LapA family protein [Alphaproteobacteria bacterium]|nr:LapA family protein [Alphaproteobacteria bacterium]
MRLAHWLLTLPLTVVAADFAVSNREAVSVGLWPLPDFATPLYVVVLVALAAGFLAGELVGWLAAGPRRRKLRVQARRIEALERELRAVEAQLAVPAPPPSATAPPREAALRR